MLAVHHSCHTRASFTPSLASRHPNLVSFTSCPHHELLAMTRVSGTSSPVPPSLPHVDYEQHTYRHGYDDIRQSAGESVIPAGDRAVSSPSPSPSFHCLPLGSKEHTYLGLVSCLLGPSPPQLLCYILILSGYSSVPQFFGLDEAASTGGSQPRGWLAGLEVVGGCNLYALR